MNNDPFYHIEQAKIELAKTEKYIKRSEILARIAFILAVLGLLLNLVS